uniref:Microtubule associated protein 1B n=1 Tax=Myotis myotis TaxID=51298 RepID=A0A7J7Y059_MYOMY|nr:microtubule associated protein 1B [Myotis myotis]
MATVVVEAAEPELSGSTANPAASTSPSLSHRFLDSKFYLLVVVGEIVTEEHLRRAIGNIELGIRSWDTNLIECNLDQELKLFVSRHSARFSPVLKKGTGRTPTLTDTISKTSSILNSTQLLYCQKWKDFPSSLSISQNQWKSHLPLISWNPPHRVAF